ncbi:MAG: hypothetical protein JO029_15730 [Candidatus Eremiobacteraeota bacterium]|nr:hypothetical protein [Candidatus Eremiobacteraeota bacterium]MBV8583336.1 hypothetical protein [Candidatus Eremiobacteraeota bacterium]
MLLAVSVPAVVASVGQRFVQTSRGYVTFRLHRVFDVHAGPSSRHDDLVLEGVFSNATLVSVRIVSDTIGGKAQTPDEIATAEEEWVHPKSGDAFHAPFDPRYFGEYSYRAQPVRSAITFTSLVSDGGHGSGSFSYDRKYDVTSYTYEPSVMPQYAKTGTVSGTRAGVLPGYWAITQETQQYQGHYALWNGGATTQYTWSDFRRFGTLAEAERAIGR